MLLKLQNISKAFGNPNDAHHQQVLKDLSMEVMPGETLAILGPSGSGKSTLLNIMGTLDYPDSGTFTFKDQLITDLKPKEIDHFRNREIGFVFQFHHLLPQCNVMENVLIPKLVQKSDQKQNASEAEELLNKVGLWEHRHKKPGQLSGGECQRVAVIRAVINHPSLILADEPTGALDSKNVNSISELLLRLNKEEAIALVVVTHSKSLASEMSSIYELKEGQLQKR
ncbi:MAG: ABC transporter ATP-binding protein [Bacteroidales bacterium]|jgi:lipoprotein-releasing system ATP-binding protein|nr:ABC transporter ATP-binding protein [Bacteroidales bacterium]